MFKRLSRNLLLLNMTIITLLLLASFSVVYLITYQNTEAEIRENLNRMLDMPKTFQDNPPKPISPDPSVDEQENNDRFTHFELDDRSLSFLIETDKTQKMISAFSFIDSDKLFFEEILSRTNLRSGIQHLEYDSLHWSYMHKERFDGGRIYAFMDTTSEQEVLNRLIFTFALVAFFTLILVFFISSYLTNRSISPIKEAFEKQTQFISDASHELKTPLAVISTNVDVLMENPIFSDSENKKWLQYIRSEVHRMGKMTKDLLYLTQMEDSENPTFVCSTFSLSSELELLLLGFEAVAYEKQMILKYTIQPNLSLFGNKEQITQVLMILLDNALKYTPPKGIIDLTLSQANHQIVLTIKNSGDGIPPEEIKHIFDRFYRMDKSRSREGGSHGLGLSIAKAIMERHKGKIECESKLHEYTCFTLRFKK
ncbi:MAG: GHKL domain-containing protein [Vallitaleaceae bacterium]|nr:GHKL domain-containing protein [Vallitaleaceae bacterium]